MQIDIPPQLTHITFTMNITAINRNIVLELDQRPEESKGGIVLPSQYSEAPTEGTVTSVGGQVDTVSVGDVVGFPAHLGTRIVIGGKEILLIEEPKALYVRG